MTRISLAYILASYPPVLLFLGWMLIQDDYRFDAGWRGAGDIATVLAMVVFAPFSWFFFFFMCGLPIYVSLLCQQSSVPLPQGVPVLGLVFAVGFVVFYRAAPRIERWITPRIEQW